MDKSALLAFIVKAVREVPETIRHLSPAYKTYDYFLARIEGLVRGVYSGNVAGDFIDIFANLISGQLRDAYTRAWIDEGNTGALPDYLEASYQETVAKQYSFVDQFYRAIVDARVDKTSIEPLLSRAQLWAQRWTESYNEAVRLITLDGGDNMIWELGATEQHCPECAFLNGKIMSAKEWNLIGIKPQNAPNKKLTCGGWKCDCSLSPTDKRRTPGAYGRIEEMMLAK